MSKYLIRILTYSFLIGPVPIVCLGLMTAYFSWNDNEAKANAMRAEILRQNQLRVEQMMRTLELSIAQFAASSPVKKALYEEVKPDDFVSIQELWMSLYNLQTFVDVQKSFLIHFDHRWVIESGRIVKFGPLEQLGQKEKERFRQFALGKESMKWMAESDTTDEPVVQLAAKLPMTDPGGAARAIVVVRIEKNQFADLMTQSGSERNYILDAAGGDFLSDSSRDKTYAAFNAGLFAKIQAQPGKMGHFNADSPSGKASVSYIVSPQYGWTYVSVTPVAAVYGQLGRIFFAILVVYVLIFIAAALLAYYGSWRMYSPVRNLYNMVSGLLGHEHPASRPDEFRHIEHQLKQLFSSKLELQQQVRGQFAQLKEFLLLKLFTGQISKSDFSSRAETYGLAANWRWLGVLVLQIDTLEGTKYKENERELLMFAVNNIVNDALPLGQRFSPILMDLRSQVTLLSCTMEDPAAVKTYLYETAEAVRHAVKTYLDLPVSVGISRPFADYAGALPAYHEALEALSCRIRLGNELILGYDDIGANQHIAADTYKQLQLVEEQLVYSVKSCDKEQIERLFDEYIHILRQKEVYNKEFSFLLLQLVSKVLQLLQEQGGTIKGVLGENAAVEQFIQFQTMDDLVRHFKQHFFPKILAFLAERDELQNSSIAEKMAKLVEERYDQDISLETCASLLNYHPSYISRVFKKHYGIAYVDYVIEYRMNMAKSYLEHTSLSIADIARKLQYMHTSAFIRAFRKIVGVTPGKYREEMQHVTWNREVET
ncbi:helix-turn-helix domain-containing protein [Paenibacillus hamazuiensis]|uniref:helix-turn-helix domain-containing protein n=1 Tax=Paenibacillus hamazuiensis TaxID=2936508 RepID=UPI00200D4072|nr:helix-turn-helix domain-containing protein [Paenibacillus hamazuiensis]